MATSSFWPALTVTKDNDVLLAWETDVDGHVAPVWMDFTKGVPTACPVQGTPYHPALTELPNGTTVLSWTETSQQGSSFACKEIRSKEVIKMGITAGTDGIDIHWEAQAKGTFQVEFKDAMSQAAWQPLGDRITTETNHGDLHLPATQPRTLRLFRVRRM